MDRGDKTMYFSLGGHPAFLPGGDLKSFDDQTLFLETQNGPLHKLNYHLMSADGVGDEVHTLDTPDGRLTLTDGLLAHDALMIYTKEQEGGQLQGLTLITEAGVRAALEIDSPVVGIWGKPEFHLPFLCIEPWYGLPDTAGFTGDLFERKFGNAVEPGKTFHAEYKITAFG